MATCTFDVLDADGTLYTVPVTVLDADGTPYEVSINVLDADGTSYAVGVCTVDEVADTRGHYGGLTKVKTKKRKKPDTWVREELIKAFKALDAEPEPPRIITEIKREYQHTLTLTPTIDYDALLADIAMAQRLIAAYAAHVERLALWELELRDEEAMFELGLL